MPPSSKPAILNKYTDFLSLESIEGLTQLDIIDIFHVVVDIEKMATKIEMLEKQIKTSSKYKEKEEFNPCRWDCTCKLCKPPIQPHPRDCLCSNCETTDAPK